MHLAQFHAKNFMGNFIIQEKSSAVKEKDDPNKRKLQISDFRGNWFREKSNDYQSVSFIRS